MEKEIDLFEIIYFGSPTKTVNFKFVNGKKMEYKRELFVNEMNNETIGSSLLNKFPLRHLGPEYENFYMVAIPCNDLIYTKINSELKKSNHKSENILEMCMIKIKEESNSNTNNSNNTNNISDMKGYKSGCRSAIVKFNGKHYRLKGCGNLDKGFNRRIMGFPKDAIDVRGCQFRHTAYREVYMSDMINEVISRFGFNVANRPVGIWLYDNVENKELDIVDDFKKIDKMCSVYEIDSEKRLGCQLLPGLEVIVFEIIKQFLFNNKNFLENNYKEVVSQLFPQNRIIHKKHDPNNKDKNITHEIMEIEPTTSFVPIIELSKDDKDTINSLFTKYKIYEEYDSSLVDIFNLHSENPILDILSDPDFIKTTLHDYLQKNEIYSIFSKINQNSKELINNLIEKILSKISNKKYKFIELLSLIYARVGWESGILKRIMQDNNINWGTYEDQPYRLHCNAHTDNYTINMRGINKSKNILSVLDFDLAFFKENFFNISDETDKDKYGNPDDFLFDSYLNMERQHLEWEFAGLENVISFDFYQEEFKEEKFNFIANAIFYLLRDTSVIHFREGYLMKEFKLKEKYENIYEDVYDLIELGLIVSHDFMDKSF